MGLLATVIAFTRSVVAGAQTPEAKLTAGGDETLTAGHFSSPGDDAHPLPGDVVFVSDDEGQGNGQIVGYQDPKTSPVAAAGEKRIYARSAPGVVAAEVWLKADGTLLLKNAVTTLELKPSGEATVGNAVGSIKLDGSGLVTFTAPLPLGSVGSHTHTHTTPFGPSGPPIPNT